MIKCRRPTTELGKVRRYFNSFHWIELPCMLDTPQNHMHQQHDKFMMAAYLHNQVVFCANVFFFIRTSDLYVEFSIMIIEHSWISDPRTMIYMIARTIKMVIIVHLSQYSTHIIRLEVTCCGTSKRSAAIHLLHIFLLKTGVSPFTHYCISKQPIND